MVVCQFFLSGRCKFGSNCRNEHPVGAQQSAFGNSSWNRSSTSPSTTTPLVGFTAAVIRNDMTQLVEKPVWPLSSYGASKYEPNLLYQLDESPEELRTKYVAAMKAGNLNEYLQYESSRIANAEEAYKSARENPDKAFEQAVSISTKAEATTTSAFGKPSGSVFPSTSSAFGGTTSTPSAFASTSSAFGNTPTQGSSAFGNPAPANSAFGSTTTPSAFGSTNPTTSAFGSTSTPTSAFGSTTTPSAFGSTTTPSAFSKPASAFGQPAFGQPAFGQTGFGTPTPATTSAFGQPQNTTTPISAFSQPAQTTTTSAFGQPAFGQPSFGQTSQPTSSVIKPASGAFSAFAGTGASPFGSTATSTPASGSGGGGFSAFAGSTPSAFGSTTVTPSSTSGSVFGQGSFGQPVSGGSSTVVPTPSSSVFGTPTQGTTSVFGTPSAFGALAQQSPAAPTSVFGGGGATTTTTVFGSTTQAPVSVFSQPTSAFGGGTFGQPAPSTITTTNTTTPSQPGLSVFAPTMPTVSMEMKTATSEPQSKPLDFTALKGVYKPGATPYDQTLPADYADILPQDAILAFKEAKFEFGSVPEWVPPVSVR